MKTYILNMFQYRADNPTTKDLHTWWAADGYRTEKGRGRSKVGMEPLLESDLEEF